MPPRDPYNERSVPASVAILFDRQGRTKEVPEAYPQDTSRTPTAEDAACGQKRPLDALPL